MTDTTTEELTPEQVYNTAAERPEALFLSDAVTVGSLVAAIEARLDTGHASAATPTGRKKIASTAHSVSKIKTGIDNAGKGLTEEWRRKTTKVNNRRKEYREALDELRDKIRKPVSDWEEQEEARLAQHRATMERITKLSNLNPTSSSAEIESAIAEIRAMDTSETAMQEFSEMATARASQVIDALSAFLGVVLKREEQEAELEQLRKAELERQQIQQQREQKRLEEERELMAQKQAELDEERRKREAAEQAQREMEEKARREKEERERQEREAAEAQAKKQADDEHKDNVRLAAAEALWSCDDITEEVAYSIVLMIEGGEIPHVTLNF